MLSQIMRLRYYCGHSQIALRKSYMFSRYLVITLMMVLCSSIGLNFMAQLSKSKFVQSEDLPQGAHHFRG